ncbi:MAG: glycoside hydrolase family 18 protein, partial [Luteimonas sp.]|nr:glycoside hydrolase family 18 protein [Luteimonas sp.]
MPSLLRQSAIALLAGLALACACAAQAAAPYRVVGYATEWNAKHVRTLEHIDTLIFAFAKVEGSEVALQGDAGERLAKLVALKQTKPSLKVSIAVGGWGAGGFSEAAATAAGREAFARSAAQLVQTHGADGIDVDWEYPGRNDAGIAASPADTANFTLLLKALRVALDAAAGEGRHYTLTIAAADGPFAAGIDIAAVEPYLDWFNLMTYDFVNSMTPTTGHHANLYASRLAPPGARSVDSAVREYLAAGVPPRKLLIGAAFYGREFGDVAPEHDGLYQRYGRYVTEHPWPKIKRDYLDHDGFVRHHDAQAQASWSWNASTHRFITYDDPESIAAKAAYVKAHHL